MCDTLVKRDIRAGARLGTRWVMMGTCVQSRREALRYFKEDVEEIDVQGRKAADVAGMKEEVVEYIEGLIAKMGNGDYK